MGMFLQVRGVVRNSLALTSTRTTEFLWLSGAVYVSPMERSYDRLSSQKHEAS